MLDSIRNFFMQAMSGPEEVEHPVHEKDIRLAACALLLELAFADDAFTEEERLHLEGAVRRQFGLDQGQAERLIHLAKMQRAEATDLWQFTSLINEHYSKGQKMVLIEIMWGLVYADGELADREALLMRKLSSLLDVEPGYLSEAKKKAAAEFDDAVTDSD